MAQVTVEDFVESLEKWTILDINKAVKSIEEKFGISAAPVAVAGPASQPVKATAQPNRK